MVDDPDPDPPAWVLTGVLGGDPPLAVFEEQPGQTDATYVVTSGDQVGEYTVGVVGKDSVVVTRGRLRWTYTMETPWS